MKKVLLGAVAIAAAITGVALGSRPKHLGNTVTGSYWFYVTNYLGLEAIPIANLQSSSMAFGCSTGEYYCAGEYTGTFILTIVNGWHWVPTTWTGAHQVMVLKKQ